MASYYSCGCTCLPCCCSHNVTTTTTTTTINCIGEPCETALDPSCIIYCGPNLPCYGIETGDSAKDILDIILDLLSICPTTTTTSTTTTTTTILISSTTTSTTIVPSTTTSTTSSTTTSSTTTSTSTSTTSSTTTTTTTPECQCYTIYIITGVLLDYSYTLCSGLPATGQIDLATKIDSVTICARVGSVTIQSIGGSTGEILTNNQICTEASICDPIITTTTTSTTTSTSTTTTTTTAPPCNCITVTAGTTDPTIFTYIDCNGIEVRDPITVIPNEVAKVCGAEPIIQSGDGTISIGNPCTDNGGGKECPDPNKNNCVCYDVIVGTSRFFTPLTYLSCDGTVSAVGADTVTTICAQYIIDYGTDGGAWLTGSTCSLAVPCVEPPCMCYNISVPLGGNPAIYKACDGTDQTVLPGESGQYCVRYFYDEGDAVISSTGNECTLNIDIWECPTTTTSTTTTSSTTTTTTEPPVPPAPPRFIATFRTTTPLESITLPIGAIVGTSNYNGTIYWGDGNTDILTNANVDVVKIHTYATPGDYIVEVEAFPGDFTGWSFFAITTSRAKIRNVLQWGPFRPGTATGIFRLCTNLTLTTVNDILDLTGVTNMASYFSNCTSLTTINNVEFWNVSNITSFSSTFVNCNNFNDDLSAWNVGSATNMSFMFQSSGNFNNGGSNSIKDWNVSNVTNMSGMFTNCTSFNQPLTNWNVSNVTDMSSMFDNAAVFNNDVTTWNVSSVTNFARMFNNAFAFNQNISSWQSGTSSVSSATTMSGMFQNAWAFNQPIGNWNVGNVTNMSFMFAGTRAFNQSLNSWNVGNVTTMESMFQNSWVFNGNITSWNTGSVTTMKNMFSQTSAPFTNAFNQNINSWNVSTVTTMEQMFFNATAFNQPLNSWIIPNVTSLNGFMQGKAPANYSSTNYDNLLISWAGQTVQPSLTPNFGTIKYNISVSQASRDILTNPPNNWVITDGGGI